MYGLRATDGLQSWHPRGIKQIWQAAFAQIKPAKINLSLFGR